jgi:hypothetical protein
MGGTKAGQEHSLTVQFQTTDGASEGDGRMGATRLDHCDFVGWRSLTLRRSGRRLGHRIETVDGIGSRRPSLTENREAIPG